MHQHAYKAERLTDSALQQLIVFKVEKVVCAGDVAIGAIIYVYKTLLITIDSGNTTAYCCPSLNTLDQIYAKYFR